MYANIQYSLDIAEIRIDGVLYQIRRDAVDPILGVTKWVYGHYAAALELVEATAERLTLAKQGRKRWGQDGFVYLPNSASSHDALDKLRQLLGT